MKRYVTESRSAAVRRLMREPVATSRLSEVEVASALVRLQREGALSASELGRVLEALTGDVQSFWIVELRPEVVALARSLLRRYTLRAGDAIQLASCLHLSEQLADPLPFVAFDSRLVEAAAAEGLTLLP